MTTMMTNPLPTDPSWNNIFDDQFFDIDELFSTTFDCSSSDPPSTIIKEDHDNSSGSFEMDHDQQLSPNLICRVCGAPATGYNFDQVTCESCKAFFRRNALKNISQMKCRFSGACAIDIRTRRQCTYCRLKKCFDVKMRKDWIRTEEEKELRQLQKLAREQKRLNRLTHEQQPLLNLPIVLRKKQRLHMKPALQNLITNPIVTQAFFGWNCDLSNEDRDVLNNITNAYQTVDDQANHLSLKPWTPPETIVDFVNGESATHELLINFYKTIPEFNQLDIKDRILLIKWNLLRIVHLHCILIHKFEEPEYIGASMTRWMGAQFHRRMSRIHHSFERFKEHPLILKLSLIVLIFSVNLSSPNMLNPSDEFLHRKDIDRMQECYTSVLWRYLNSIYGEEEAIRSMVIIMTRILHYQQLMTTMEEYIGTLEDARRINQLETSLLRLTV